MTIIADLTVAVATLDRPKDLRRCLDALLGGDALPAELLVVDQSAGDETRRLVESLPSPTRLVYVHQDRRGLSASRNGALACASRPILAVTDDDCVPDRGWVATFSGAFQATSPPDVVTGRVLPLGPEAPGLYAVSSRTSTMPRGFAGKVAPWLVGTGGNFAVRVDWLCHIGGYDERLGAGSPGRAGEDTDLIYRLLRAGAHAHYEPAAVVYHQRQTKARRTASRWSYGRGIGASGVLWLRDGDWYGLRVVGTWLFNHAWAATGAARRGRWTLAREEMLMVLGTFQGMAYALHAPATRRWTATAGAGPAVAVASAPRGIPRRGPAPQD